MTGLCVVIYIIGMVSPVIYAKSPYQTSRLLVDVPDVPRTLSLANAVTLQGDKNWFVISKSGKVLV